MVDPAEGGLRTSPIAEDVGGLENVTRRGPMEAARFYNQVQQMVERAKLAMRNT